MSIKIASAVSPRPAVAQVLPGSGKRGLSRVIILLAFVIVLLTRLEKQVRGDQGNVLVQLVQDAMADNLAQIRTADYVLREECRTATTSDAGKQMVRQIGGKQVIAQSSPVQESLLRITISDDRIRVLREADHSLKEAYLFANDAWTQYVPHARTAWRRRPGEMPGSLALDPRHYGSPDVSRPLSDVLAETTIVRAALKSDARRGMFVEIVTRPPVGVETVFEFDRDAAFLPTAMTTRWPDGSIVQSVSIAYSKPQNIGPRLPIELVRRFYNRGVALTSNAEGWRQECTRAIVGPLRINADLEDSGQLELEIPPGTRMRDNLHRAVFDTIPVASERVLPRYGRWSTALLVAVLIGAVIRKHIVLTAKGANKDAQKQL